MLKIGLMQNKWVRRLEKVMISIALIGGTGTGKSTIAKYLQDNYEAVWLDCDAIGHRLLNDPAIQERLIARFGQEIADYLEEFVQDHDAKPANEPVNQSANVQENKKEDYKSSERPKRVINRKKLGAIVFQDKQALADLNELIHPPIMNELKIGQKMAEAAGASFCILDGALLMDVNVRALVDEVWAITAGRECRIRRLMEGRNLDRAKAEQIMKNQISPEEYAAYADKVIATDQGEAGYAKAIRDYIADGHGKQKRGDMDGSCGTK